uniref:ORF4 n=1 Tax=Taro bacilliform virus TaxID=178354 RepID=A0A384ZCZ3_9VIRU|nr:ORF4 [Taro bacilliform virus]
MVTFHSGFLITIKHLLTVLLRIVHILILMKMKTNLLVFFLMGKKSWSILHSLQFMMKLFLLLLMEKKFQTSLLHPFVATCLLLLKPPLHHPSQKQSSTLKTSLVNWTTPP